MDLLDKINFRKDNAFENWIKIPVEKLFTGRKQSFYTLQENQFISRYAQYQKGIENELLKISINVSKNVQPYENFVVFEKLYEKIKYLFNHSVLKRNIKSKYSEKVF